MGKKITQQFLSIIFSVILITFTLLVIACNIYLSFLEKTINKIISIFLIFNAIIIIFLLFLLIYMIISHLLVIKKNKELKTLCFKLTHITPNDDVNIIQYNVKEKNFIYWNDKEDIPPRSFSLDEYWTRVCPKDLDVSQKLMEYMNNQTLGNYSCDYRYKIPETETYAWYITDVIPYKIDKDGKVISYMGLCRKNDKCHIMMEQISELRTMTEMVKLLSNFIENIGYKIITPLNAIIGFSDLMNDENSEEIKTEYRKIINENSNMLLRMSNDILTFAEIESGRQLCISLSFDIEFFFRYLIRNVKKTISQGINLILHSEDTSFRVTLDSSMLERIITSLFNFMIGFTKKGDINIKYAEKDSGLYVIISDSSFYIKEKYQHHLFSRFDNFDKSSKYIPGIGLPLCKALIIKNNGKIRVDSDSKKGTSFRFWIPCPINKQLQPEGISRRKF